MLPAMGMSIDTHWCGKRVKLISIYAAHENKCPCGKKMSKGCCKDVHLWIKLSQNQKSSSQQPGSCIASNSIKETKVIDIFSLSKISSPFIVIDFTKYHAPPYKYKQ